MEVEHSAPGAPQDGAFAALLSELSIEGGFREGSELEGIVESIERDYVVVNAGLKSESYVPIDEFVDEDSGLEVNVGDKVRVRIELTDNGQGQTVLSRMQVKRRLAWHKIKQAYEEEETVSGVIKERVKGGFIVAIEGYRAFLPGSQVDVVPAKDLGAFLGMRSDFCVIKMEPSRGGVVVSRRMCLERLRTGKFREEAFAAIQEGQVVRGTVSSIAEYGVFVDIGDGLYGLLHITDLAWKRVTSVTDHVNIGDELELKILSVDREKGRISFGLKQMQQDPWENIDRLYSPHQREIGRVSNITEYGAFVELQDGIYGLVHTSEMDWSRRTVDPAQVVSIGEEIEVMVLDIDKKKRRISLGIKQCKSNPWQDFNAAYRSGSVLKGAVKTITDFGLFVSLPGGLDGLVRLGDLSYKESGERAIRNYSKGMEVEVVVLSIDVDEEKITLGIKQLEDSGFNRFAAEHLKGTTVTGKVLEVGETSAIVQIAEDVRGVLPASELSESRTDKLSDKIKVGEEMEFMLANIDKRNHVVTLSLKALDRAERERILREMSSSAQSAAPALGALLQAKMDESAAAERQAEAQGSGADSSGPGGAPEAGGAPAATADQASADAGPDSGEGAAGGSAADSAPPAGADGAAEKADADASADSGAAADTPEPIRGGETAQDSPADEKK